MGAEAEKYQIRDMLETDIAQVVAIDAELFAERWSAQSFREELANAVAHYRVMECQGVVIGYYGFWLILDEAEVTRIGLTSSCQGKGLGGTLFDVLLVQAHQLGARQMGLEVRESNLVAQKLYASRGFALCGRRKHYYVKEQEDALLMRGNV